jgi:hypothetical protein
MPETYLPPLPLEKQIACVQRELAMRRKVYPKRVQAQFMTPGQMLQEIRAMEAVLQTLEWVQAQEQPALFDAETHKQTRT